MRNSLHSADGRKRAEMSYQIQGLINQSPHDPPLFQSSFLSNSVLMNNNVRPVRHNGLECYGDGFTFASHPRADTATIVEALQSAGSKVKSAEISKNQKIDRKKSWWSAQARLYGLRGPDWSIGTCMELLRKALEKGLLEVPQKLKDAEARANKEYAIEAAKVREMKEHMARVLDDRY